jgi:hypothetical protein
VKLRSPDGAWVAEVVDLEGVPDRAEPWPGDPVHGDGKYLLIRGGGTVDFVRVNGPDGQTHPGATVMEAARRYGFDFDTWERV